MRPMHGTPAWPRAWCRRALPALALAVALIPWLGAGPVAAAEPAGAVFSQLYAATDAAPAGGRLWGEPLLERDEPYREGAGGLRRVRYYAKGRMELTRPEAGLAGVSYGRLVHELVTGGLAVGDAQTLQYAGADIPVAGDRDRAANPEAPTYRALRPLLGRAASAVGRPVETVLLPPEGAGVATAVVATRRDPALGQLAVNAVYLSGPGHNIPAVFWETLTAQGAAGGRELTWTALYGWPLTEAFWVRARQEGRPFDALVQLFERRTLIYQPAAPAGQQVTAGDVGRDYLRWRDGRTNPAPDLRPPPSRAGLALPPVGEAGTTFLVAAAGFKDGERVDAWLEAEGAVYPQTIRLRRGGLFLGRLRTAPVASGPLDIRIVIQGRTSGHVSVIQLRVLATDALTPGAEAAEPAAVPPGRDAQITPALLAVGAVGELRAAGFAPGEPVTAWVTTGLNRVIPYATYLGTVRRAPEAARAPAVQRTLKADDAGRVVTGLPGPGLATGGVFAVTLAGDRSGHTAVAYFRARAGAPWVTNSAYGYQPEAPAPSGAPPPAPAPLTVVVDEETVWGGAPLAALAAGEERGARGGGAGMLMLGAGGLARQRRRRTALLALALLAALLPAWPGLAALPLDEGAGAAAIPGEVIVTLADGVAPAATPAELPAALQPLVARFAIDQLTRLPGTTTYRLRSAAGADPAALAAAFAASELVTAAEPNLRLRLAQAGPDDPLYQGGNQWHLQMIDIAAAWAITTGSPAVPVAVVDTGIDVNQPDLAGKVIGGYDFVDETFTLRDDVGHGTAVASFITANTGDGKGLAGLAPEARVLAFRVLGRNGGASFDAARGIIAAADAGARVINCSFGGPAPARVFQQAIEYAHRKGAVVIAAAGNSGSARPNYPAADRHVIAIGASNWRDEVAGFSQRGAHVAVVAPGAGVLGAVAGGDQAVVNGTSFSAPVVSGVVALMLAANPALTPDEVRRILEGTADDIGPAGFDEAAGWGRVNAGRAVAAARAGDTLPNRRSVIRGRVSGVDPGQVVISVDPFGEVIRPLADGSFELIDRGRTTYALRATARGAGALGPVLVATTGQAGDVRTVDFAFAP
jgi:subtilisin family serine protease